MGEEPGDHLDDEQRQVHRQHDDEDAPLVALSSDPRQIFSFAAIVHALRR
jgi:hypothetical protein